MADLFVTLEQIKAARALLQWTQKDLAAHAGLNDAQVHSFESGRTRSLEVMEAVCLAFMANNIEFLGRDGVRVKKDEITVLHGKEGFETLFNDIYETVKAVGGELALNNASDEKFMKWAQDIGDLHQARMKALNNFTFRILVEAGDTSAVSSSYAEYRKIPKEEFSSVPFYVYGTKLAILLLDHDPIIYIINSAEIAQAYLAQFNRDWKRAIQAQNAERA